MRTYPDNESDLEDLTKLNAESRMVEVLKLNPDYVFWGPHEDYMCNKNAGWQAPVFVYNWQGFKWKIDDLNECVNFYFEIERDSVECEACDGEGYNPQTVEISRTFYDFEQTGGRWCDRITQDEADTLWKEGRLYNFKSQPTAEQVNHKERLHHIHDAINRHILIRARAERLGVYGWCHACGGDGHRYIEPAAHLNLILWMIHPRKGASRGVEIKHIRQDDMPAIIAWLKQAAERNARRFVSITSL